MQSSNLGMWKGYHSSIEGIWKGDLFWKKGIYVNGKGLDLGIGPWYPGALSPVLENFRRAYSLDPTDCPRVSEDDLEAKPLGI